MKFYLIFVCVFIHVQAYGGQRITFRCELFIFYHVESWVSMWVIKLGETSPWPPLVYPKHILLIEKKEHNFIVYTKKCHLSYMMCFKR